MKALKRIIWTLVIVAVIVYVLPVILMQIPVFQQKILRSATGYLEERIGSKVEIRKADFRLFNQLILKDVYMEDQQGDTLLIAKRIAAGIDFFPLFKKQLRFGSVQLYTFALHLSKASPEAPLNIQYIIDTFRNEEPTKPGAIDLRIQSLFIRGGAVSYRMGNATPTPDLLNPADLYWKDVAGKIRIKHCTNDSLLASVQGLGATEQSGFCIQQVVFDLSANSNEAKIKQLDITLPQSVLHLTNITAGYSRSFPDEKWMDKMEFNLQVEPSHICLNDVQALSPVFSWWDEALNMEGSVSGALDHIQLKDFSISSGNDMHLGLDVTVGNLKASDLSRMHVNGRILPSYITAAGIQQMANNFSPEPVVLPEQLQNLGSVSLEGGVSGGLNNLTANVNLRTGVGNLQADVNFGRDKTNFLIGKLATTGMDLKEWLANDDLGNTRFEIDLNARFTHAKDWEGTVDALVNEFDYKTYRYENIGFSGAFTANSFNGSLKANDAAGQFAANGSFVLDGENSKFNFSAEATNLLLDQLHWTQKYLHPKLSFAVDAGFTGDNPDNLMGKLSFRKLSFSNSQGLCSFDSLYIESLQREDQKQLQIRSDFLTGTIDGVFSIYTVAGAFKQSLAAYLPSLILPDSKMPDDHPDFQWNLTINDTRKLSSVLELPVVFYGQSQITGEYNSWQNRFRLNGNFPLFKFGASIIENGKMDLSNSSDSIDLKLNGTYLQQRKGNKLVLAANIKALNDSIRSSIRWNNDTGSKYQGTLDFTSHWIYQKKNYPLTAFIQIQPSEMVFNDSIWQLSPTSLRYQDGCLHIDPFEANHKRQKITMKGDISKNAADQVYVSLNEVDLDYVFKSLNIKVLEFGGIATGFVTANDLLDSRQVSTQLEVQNFSFNNVVFGDMELRGRWDKIEQGVEMKGNIVQNDTTYVGVDGFIYPVKKELSIVFDAHHGNAAFLRKYLDNTAKNISGRVTGKIHLFGALNKPTVEGDVWVDDGSFEIEILNTRYTFSDWLRMTPDKIFVQNIELRDVYGNKAKASGTVHHHFFSDFQFDAHVLYENFLVFNAGAATSPSFYGKAYGTGTVTIQGTEELVNIDVSLRNDNNTAMTLNLMEQLDIVDYNFIHFVTKADTVRPASSQPSSTLDLFSLPKPKLQTEIRANLLITATPEATVELIMDPSTGDKISATGDGNLRIEYGTKIPLRVFGNYRIEKGSYNFSFQQAFFRNFKIGEGSSVNFYGDPFTATLDIKAAYTVSANLGDLDQQLVQQTESNRRLSARDNVLVNCVLLLSGPLKYPVIKFDLGFPEATADVERQVKSYIRTDDMMNRQMIYLLLMGRFYTAPEYVRSDFKFNNDLSYLTSTLSTYISSLLGSLSDKFQIGTKFHQTYESGGTNTEMELLLSSALLNNRLIINGNFGYIDNPYLNASNKNVPLIGDFDIEYKLTKAGDIRLKGFNRYNYRNYYSLTPEMTQGFGILFRRDFNSVNDLFGKARIVPALDLPVDTVD